MKSLLLATTILGVSCCEIRAQDQTFYDVGFGKVDITPTYPIRLNGFGNRREESAGVSQEIFARAMAISQGDTAPFVVVAIDSLGIRLTQVNEVARRLRNSRNLPRENFALTFTHSHCTPKVIGACDNIFSEAIPPAHQEHISQYTAEVIDAITKSAEQAIDSRQRSTLGWSVGNVGFAKNRRPWGGPVDHNLPTLIVRDAQDNSVRGVYVSYACHCVTLRFNKISGDWAGYAAEMIERQFPDAIALVSIGAGSDQNPTEVTPDDVQIAQRQGAEIGAEVHRLANIKQRRVEGPIQATLQHIDLPLNELPTREQLADIAEHGQRPTDRYNAATQIAKLDRGEELLSAIDYPIQTCAFGDSLCITFLAGEVCVDYAVRLKQEFAADRYWLITYSNDFCSYIPSERLVLEGGYGGGSETPYFALPTTLAAGLEQKIVDQVHRQTPPTFEVPAGVEGVAPKSPKDSLNCIQTNDNLHVSLAAAEPLVCDPVAIEFGIDGCLWVAEMPDYGRGVYEGFTQHGRIRCLRDEDGDGKFDNATTFTAGLRFPTDVKVWRDGLLICDAPDILLARDTNGDGTADQIKTLFSGFEVRNAQARVNSLRWGLDNWLHGSCGLFGGEIKSHKTGRTTSLLGRDFRMNPDTGEIEAVSGRTQQGRCRNDWGDWFGCSNGTLLRHYADEDCYSRRNPFIPTSPVHGLTGNAEAHRLYPPHDLVQFELTGTPGKATSACGLGIYRDIALGDEYFGSAFTCEPVHQLVHRIKLTPNGLEYNATRGAGETESEFLMSNDRWFRPVQARTGPDGALWVVDMYRYVIEHPRWIPQSTLSELDVFAGHRRGRIYRVTSSDKGDHRPLVRNLTKFSNSELTKLLESTNGTIRDLAHQMLVWRDARDVVTGIRDLVTYATLPQSKIQSLAILDAMDALDHHTVLAGLKDQHAEVVRHAVRLSESALGESQEVRAAVSSHAAHESPRVRRQVAWSLGETDSDETVPILAALAAQTEPVAHVRSAVVSSIRAENAAALMNAYFDLPQSQQVSTIKRQIVKSAIRLGELDEIEVAINLVSQDTTSYALLTDALDAADARVGDSAIDFSPELQWRIEQIFHFAMNDMTANSLGLLCRFRGKATQALLAANQESTTSIEHVIGDVAKLLSSRQPVQVQLAAVEALAKTRHPSIAKLLLERHPLVSMQARAAIIDAVLSQPDWTSQLLDRVETGSLRTNVLDAARRSLLLGHADKSLRDRAADIFDTSGSPSRVAVIESYSSALKSTGSIDRGREHFRKHCAACHKLEGHGHIVGPDLSALTNRDPAWLLTALLDPNRDVDARYLAWSAVAEDGRVVSGLVQDETASTIRLRESGGKEHVLLRETIEQFRANNTSLMPEGLEKDLTPQDISDLIAYLSHAIGPVPTPAKTATLPRYPPQIAPFLLDDSQSMEVRTQVIDQRPGMGPAIVGLLVNKLRQLSAESPAQHIPWIWRVSLAVGRRNDGGEIRDLLDLSLPQADQQLEPWQAVVVGGGIINGLTQVGQWPNQRLKSIFAGAPSLRSRWQQTLRLAAKMADSSDVRSGIRYDALRIVALAEPSMSITHLQRYLAAGMDRQLQMGAVSGLADIESPDVAALLIDSLSFLEDRNRNLAVEGLLRTKARSDLLLQAASSDKSLVQTTDFETLLEHQDKEIATNATRLAETLKQ